MTAISTAEARLHADAEWERWNVREVVPPNIHTLWVWQFSLVRNFSSNSNLWSFSETAGSIRSVAAAFLGLLALTVVQSWIIFSIHEKQLRYTQWPWYFRSETLHSALTHAKSLRWLLISLLILRNRTTFFCASWSECSLIKKPELDHFKGMQP